MQLSNNEVTIQRTGEMKESYFGISEKDSVHIISILRNKLYSNKIAAVVREYTTNAVDAHVEAGKADVPIEVTLPNALNTDFVVRDYGAGLSEEEIREVYAIYGASTKRNSNEVIGQLGLGCKSAFSYVDQFNITSWNNGTKSIYSAYIDETGIGKVALLFSEESDEPSGIEIKIPTKREDDYRFIAEAVKLFQFFDVMPDCCISIAEKDVALEGSEGDVRFKIIRCPRWTDNSYIVMGGVPYKSDMLKEYININYDEYDVEVYVPIGLVDISANREYIEDTKHSRRNLKDTLSLIDSKIFGMLSEKAENASSYLEALDSYSHLKNIIKGKLSTDMFWNGYRVDFKQYFDGFCYDIEISEDAKAATKRREKSEISTKEFLINKDRCIIVVDEDEKPAKIRNQVRKSINFHDTARTMEGSIIYNYVGSLKVKHEGLDEFTLKSVIDNKTVSEHVSEKITELRDKGFNVRRYSTVKLNESQLEQLRASNRKSNVPSTTNPKLREKHNGKVFKLWGILSSGAKSQCWKKLDLNNDPLPEGQKIYVPIYRFEPNSPCIGSLSSLNKLYKFWKFYKNEDLLTDITLYGVKEETVKKLDSTWILLEEYIANEIAKDKKTFQYASLLHMVNTQAVRNIKYLREHYWPQISCLDKESKLKKVVSFYRDNEDYLPLTFMNSYGLEEKMDSISFGFRNLVIKKAKCDKYTEEVLDFIEKVNKLEDDYKLVASYFIGGYRCPDLSIVSEDFIKEDILGYVKMKDKQRKGEK